MKTRYILSVLLCLLFLSSILSAAIQDDQPQNRRRARENMRTLWLLRITRVLELTEEQTAKVFPIVSRIEKEKSEIYQQIGKQVRELRLILKEEEPDQNDLKNKINEIKELRNLIKKKDEELEARMEENLTLIQRAKYLMFAANFYRDLRDNLDRARIQRERQRQKIKKDF
jgi:Spy/CpxP family protein refolding chaperone